jgi:formate--tetrahydrofolate ligase
VPPKVEIQAFANEIQVVPAAGHHACLYAGAPVEVHAVHLHLRLGGKGGEELAREVVRLCEEEKGDFQFSYSLDNTLEERIDTLVRRVYRGAGISVLPAARKQMERLTALGYGQLPICVAKTQYSFSDTPTLLGAPEDFTVTIRQLKVSAGAGFVVVLTGHIMTMPGLPKVPAAEKIDVDENGKIAVLF